MKTEHTPGPWINPVDSLQIDSADGTAIADVWDDDVGTECHATANAKLIAAAPDLLEALREIMEGIDEYWAEHNVDKADRALSAIRKATTPASRAASR